jgi:hypothetical protein
MVTMTRAGDPSFGLTVRRRIEYSSESLIFMIATAGNLEGIKWLLNRKASPNDVTLQSGQTALHVRLGTIVHQNNALFLAES